MHLSTKGDGLYKSKILNIDLAKATLRYTIQKGNTST
jgi:hypothetical protein